MKDISNQLHKQGFSEREAQVYLTLLALGPSSGGAIAKKSGMVISTVYFVLEELRKKGLVNKAINAKKSFVAKDPRDLFEEKRRDMKDFENLLPRLLAQTKIASKPSVRYFEGMEGIGEAYKYLAAHTTSQEMVAMFTYSPEKIEPARMKVLETGFHGFGKHSIHIRAVQPDHTSTTEFIAPYKKKYGWETREIPLDEFSPLIATFITGNYVLTTSRRKGQSLLIENEDTAHAQKQVFEILWQRAKKFQKITK